VCTDKQYREYTAQKAKRYRLLGIIAVCIVIISGILRKCGVYLEDITNDIIPNILTGIVLISLIAWIVGSISVNVGKAAAKESYVMGSDDEIIFHTLKSRDPGVVGQMRTVYHTYHISRIRDIIEKPSYYEIYGTVILIETVNQHQSTREIEKVKIPRYFDGLDNLIKDLKQRNYSQEDVSNGK